MTDKNIDESNYRQTAKDAIKKYADNNMILDSMFWSRIIGLYEKELMKK